jgi:hypothetical protein
MDLTYHSVKRIRKRLGINKSGAQRELERTESCMAITDCTGRLRKYLDRQKKLHGVQAHFRITPNTVYAFKGTALTTAWIMPKKHAKSALSQWKRFKENKDGPLKSKECGPSQMDR